MQKVAIVGSGYVGLVTGACFAHLGNKVICVDNDLKKIRMLRKGKVPIYEPGLDKMIAAAARKKKISFTANLAEAIRECDIIFICVNTPPKDDGGADLSYVENVSRQIAKSLKRYCLIVEKSTVPVQTGERVFRTIRDHVGNVEFDVASNPEFLREGSAIEDFLNPDRVVIGVSSAKAEKLLKQLYAPLKSKMVVTDIKSAEIIKHASNSFLATKISFINAVARVCDAVGADVEKVAAGMGLDPRIGPSFLKAGIGFGGFCFPKDLAAFYHMSQKLGVPFELLQEVLNINEAQKAYFVKKIENVLWNLRGKRIALLGLAFKGNTDDMRFAPSIDIIHALQKEGVELHAYDPEAMDRAREVLKGVVFAKNAYEACRGADAVALITDWKAFQSLNWSKIRKLVRQPVVFDGRNFLEPEVLQGLGFHYHGIGRNV